MKQSERKSSENKKQPDSKGPRTSAKSAPKATVAPSSYQESLALIAGSVKLQDNDLYKVLDWEGLLRGIKWSIYFRDREEG